MTNVPKVSATACIGIPGNATRPWPTRGPHQAFQQRIDWSCHRRPGMLKDSYSATMNPPMAPPASRDPLMRSPLGIPRVQKPTPGPGRRRHRANQQDARLIDGSRDCHPARQSPSLPIRMRML